MTSASPANTYDYIIIGAGSAGCMLAKRLTENPAKRVLLIEAGKNDNYIWIHVPVGYLYCIDNPRADWRFKTTAEPGLNGRSLLYPRGRVLGGCSSINGMIYMRGQEGDYASWVKATGDDAWSWENALQRYKEFEDYHGAASQWHGKGGEWTVSKQRLRWPIMDIFREAAVEAGIPASDDFNQGDNFGVGYFDVSQRKGWRLNTSKAFLRDAAKRPNLTVITEAMVNKLLIDSNSKNCYGVQFIKDGKVTEVHCDTSNQGEVILSAGTIGSVQVLERSGIGSAAHLNKLGIPVVADLPGVGENLQDHLQLRMIYKVSGIKTLNTKANSLLGKLMIGMEYVFKRSGPMSMAPSQLGAFAYSSPDQPSANVEYHVQPLSLEKFGEDLHSFNAITASVCNLRPTSRGSVHISSIDPEVPPMIAPNYLSTNEDRKVAVDSLRLTRKIVESPALNPYTPEEYKPGKQYQSDDELIKAAGDIGTTIFHPVGTCKMGLDDDPMAVLDSQLRVRGIHHLRVVDASAMPTITSGNTAAPTMMIAQRAAQLLTGE
ncbi:MAG: GMC family oxidoreductase N-terminal domain-containing protein [Polynucleobacter sp.]|uniref:Choline dehydrogenase n=1 Tax=Polynucleobacter aenigmaticus TaxID=1743164 RepID=A0A254Q167_9BURK|nr:MULTISPECIES: GMC family oxidoreductase N-terminal domain-containing protein [Polynucleobacter]MDO8712954.1 GMC family oxidoreductase N-terminal domain-containing protein [Polynucleobacter sp.]OWS72284.1 choline dehydrogenase [Polynucleobacter aenigmaticus]